MSKRWNSCGILALLMLVCMLISCGVANGPRKAWMNGSNLMVSYYLGGGSLVPCAVLITDSVNTHELKEYDRTICHAIIVDPENKDIRYSEMIYPVFEEFGPDVLSVLGYYEGIIVDGAVHRVWHHQARFTTVKANCSYQNIAQNVVNITISGLSDEAREGVNNGKFDTLVLYSDSLSERSKYIFETVTLYDVPLSKREYYYVSERMKASMLIASVVILIILPFVLKWRKRQLSAKPQPETELTESE